MPLRIAVAGEAARPLDGAERTALVAAIERCLDDGAIGVSTGLMYPAGDVGRPRRARRRSAGRWRATTGCSPSTCATTATTCSRRVDEALDDRPAERLPAAGLAPRGRRAAQLGQGAARARADRARRSADGVDVAVDIYPYIAGSANLSQLLPEWAQAGGPPRSWRAWAARTSDAAIRRGLARPSLFFGWDEIEVASSEPGLEETLGLTVEAVADAWSMDPNETALELIARSDNRVVMVAYGRSEDDLRAVLGHELTSIGSDGLAMDPGRAVERRPAAPAIVRVLPAVPRALRPRGRAGAARTRRPDGDLGPADRAGLTDRGRIAEGAVADLVVFDPATIVDGATFQDPKLPPTGIRHVIVAGRQVVDEGRQLDAVRPGRVSRLTPGPIRKPERPPAAAPRRSRPAPARDPADRSAGSVRRPARSAPRTARRSARAAGRTRPSTRAAGSRDATVA